MKPIIIAELGINHLGNMHKAVKMIILAKEAGADIAKFQLYDPRKLLNEMDFSIADWEAILDAELSFNQTKFLRYTCHYIGIEFMASAFDTTRLYWLETLKVKRHKIASRSLYDKEYIAEINDTGKEVFVSLGMFNNDIEPLWTTMYRFDRPKYLYCVSKYPAPLSDIIPFCRDTFNGSFYAGFSDHTVGINKAKEALAYGAQIIEKHITLDKNLPGPDQSSSITFGQLKKLCDYRDYILKRVVL